MLKYSVRIPTYNRAYCILDAVDSAVKSAKNCGVENSVEIVIVDDGSTDDTEHVVSEYVNEHTDICIRFYRLEENRGVAVARNIAGKISEGEWIVDLDSDDQLSLNAFSVYETYIEKYPEVVVFAFGGKNSNGAITVHVQNKDHISKDWKEYFEKGKYYDGEFQHVLKSVVDEEFPFKEGLNGGEGVKWYLINKKYYNRTLHSEIVTRHYNTKTTDSIMRSEWTKSKIENAINICEYRLSVMEEDLRLYSPKGKDGLAMSYAILGKYYLMLGDKKRGIDYTIRAWKANITEPRVYHNVLRLIGIVK